MPPPNEIPTTQLHVLVEGTSTPFLIDIQRGTRVGNIMNHLYCMREALPSLKSATLETMELWKVSTGLHNYQHSSLI